MNDGGPAFPEWKRDKHGNFTQRTGMTLRQWYAGQALVGLIIEPRTVSTNCPISARAYELADAMLERGEVQPESHPDLERLAGELRKQGAGKIADEVLAFICEKEASS